MILLTITDRIRHGLSLVREKQLVPVKILLDEYDWRDLFVALTDLPARGLEVSPIMSGSDEFDAIAPMDEFDGCKVRLDNTLPSRIEAAPVKSIIYYHAIPRSPFRP